MLPPDMLERAPKNALNPRMIAEFLKTAVAIRRDPWRLNRGAAYLEELCRESSINAGAPPKVTVIFQHGGDCRGVPQLPVPSVAEIFEPGAPRTQHVPPNLEGPLPATRRPWAQPLATPFIALRLHSGQ